MPRRLDPPPRVLHWNVNALAQQRQITSVVELADVLKISRQGLYGLWRDEAANVTLVQLGRLCHALDAEPGSWFTWATDDTGERLRIEDAPVLIWALDARRRALGLPQTEIIFRSKVHQRSMSMILKGTQTHVFIDTLARLAVAFEELDREYPERIVAAGLAPFSIGTLFTWDKPDPEPSDDAGAAPKRRRRLGGSLLAVALASCAFSAGFRVPGSGVPMPIAGTV